MKITNEAKTLITEAFASNNCDCVVVLLQQSCCSSSLNFGLGNLKEGDEPVIINDIPVLMDAEAQVRTENVTLAGEDSELVIQDDSPSYCC